jgi:hypothetical protein
MSTADRTPDTQREGVTLPERAQQQEAELSRLLAQIQHERAQLAQEKGERDEAEQHFREQQQQQVEESVQRELAAIADRADRSERALEELGRSTADMQKDLLSHKAQRDFADLCMRTMAPKSVHLRLPEIRPWSGAAADGPFHVFLQRFEAYCTEQAVPATQKAVLFKALLLGNAAAVVATLQPSASFAQLTDQLKLVYATTLDPIQIRLRVRDAVQRKGESVRQFYARLVAIDTDAVVDVDTLLCAFVAGLHLDTAQHVRRKMSKIAAFTGQAKLHEALRRASAFEDASLPYATSPVQPDQFTTCPASLKLGGKQQQPPALVSQHAQHQPQLQQQQQRQQQPQQQQFQQRFQQKPQQNQLQQQQQPLKQQFSVQSASMHSARQFGQQFNSSQADVRCYGCGDLGHIWRYCPSRGYNRQPRSAVPRASREAAGGGAQVLTQVAHCDLCDQSGHDVKSCPTLIALRRTLFPDKTNTSQATSAHGGPSGGSAQRHF